MNEIKTCEVCGATEDVAFYEWPVQDEITGKGITVCPNHAAENGFCSMCGYFVLGSDDDWSMDRHGVCGQCLDELRCETGEYDAQDEDGFGFWNEYIEYVDIIEGEEGGRYIGEGSEFAADDEESGR